MTDLAHRERDPELGESSAIIRIIERAAVDPNIDIDKLERLLSMQERVMARTAEQAFNEALNAAQAELAPIAAEESNTQTKSKYATFAALDRVVRPVYAKHGFSLSFNTAEAASGYVRVICRLAHRDGHKELYQVDMPADGKGAKGGDVMTLTHAAGAAMSYGQRYLLKLIFNMAVYQDKDGNMPTSPRDASAAAQAATAAINECKTLAELKAWKVKNAEGLKLLPDHENNEIVRLWRKREAAMKGDAQ